MLSVVIPARNAKELTANCLNSCLQTFRNLGTENEVEYILIDDCSDAQYGIADLYRAFKQQTRSRVQIIRFNERQFYTGGAAMGLSLAQGEMILFLSNDMILTPQYVRGVTAVAALDPAFGLVRGTSQYVDSFPQHCIMPPLAFRTLDDVVKFSTYVSDYFGLQHVEDDFLTGDAMIIRRSLIEKIGTMDARFGYGYFGDVDFGLRAQCAGFKLVCAKGAWLFHEGAGYFKHEAAVTGTDGRVGHAKRMEQVNIDYGRFREKWDPSLPPNYESILNINFGRLRAKPDIGFELFQAKLAATPDKCQILS